MRKILSLILIAILLTGCSSKKEYIEPTTNTAYYEVFLASFYDSDGDGIGDIQGLIQKLDYIQYDVGANALWLMPIHPSPTYHKYDVTNYYEIDEVYGSLDDFQELIQELEQRNMTIIIDLVLNHTSSEHPWFVEGLENKKNNTCDSTSYCDYYNFSSTFDAGYTKVNNDLYYESVFWSEMPDLNLDNEEVRKEILDITQYWLDLGVDGFRLDATTHYYGENTQKNVEFLKWFGENVRKQNEDVYIVGEAWTAKQVIQDMYASDIDSFFNFSFSGHDGTILKNINNENGYELGQKILEYNQEIQSVRPNASDAVFISNHDTGRSAGFITTIEKQKLVASIYLLMPGNVFIYYGEEIGMKGSGIDENKRLAMPWGEEKGLTQSPIGSDYTKEQTTTVSESLKDGNSLLNHYYTVLQIRNQFPELTTADFKVVDTGNKEIMYLEYNSVIIIHNLSEKSLDIKLTQNDIITLQGSTTFKQGMLTLDGLSSVVIQK